ncbi:hypothetical protein DICPUDRAFT_159733 [Dictyostelium purpureum]|uniref:BLOC-1-related complex subunit 8 n=1 Tax=Dictyostelium purpureum TaxID=5786 RepID=F1A4V1_DICPU|nr:uncharacterized protein DICPUDRAFT_159733 [Dictyostelium purpureum]EGC28781.1 hypothetical protein DICPUDRAFT_159733 [Dictyostelium purpureum]|eukprot:XP_003294695.1 hypothetical protein DICPUDRAFT_159733 [Dictyostelium purpureum]
MSHIFNALSNSIGSDTHSTTSEISHYQNEQHQQYQQQFDPNRPVLTLDMTTAKLMYQTNQEMSSYIQQIANEPTIGLFHVQDHIRRNIPKNINLKNNIKDLGDKIEEKSFDIDYSTKTIQSFKEIETFSNISNLLQASIEKANKLVNNKSLLFVNSQTLPSSSSKTFSSYKNPNIVNTPTKSNNINNNNNNNINNDNINNDNINNNNNNNNSNNNKNDQEEL